MPSLARQGRKKSPLANSVGHPGGQQFANCEWPGISIFAATSLHSRLTFSIFRPKWSHFFSSHSYWLANFFFTSKSSWYYDPLLLLIPRGGNHFRHVILKDLKSVQNYVRKLNFCFSIWPVCDEFDCDIL